jgi:hypothetical protein
MGSDRSTTIPNAVGMCGGVMEVQVIEVPTPWVQPTGEDFELERSAFLRDFEEKVVNSEAEIDDAPF